MSEKETTIPAGRIEQLEGEIYRLKLATRRFIRVGLAAIVAIVSIVGVGGAALLDIPVAEVLAARKFVLVDPNTNKERIVLGFDESRSSMIQLNDENGNAHMLLITNRLGDHTQIRMYNVDGQQKVLMGINNNSEFLNINGKNLP